MRSVIRFMTFAAAGILVLASGTARASVVDVKIPFPFVVQNQSFPAGTYQVERDTGNPGAMLIRSDKGNHAMYVLTTPAAGSDPKGNQPSLTFTKHENEYRLTDIWESAHQGEEISQR